MGYKELGREYATMTAEELNLERYVPKDFRDQENYIEYKMHVEELKRGLEQDLRGIDAGEEEHILNMDVKDVLRYGIEYLENLLEKDCEGEDIEGLLDEKEGLEKELSILTSKREKKFFGIF